jgi:sigma-E factor negative regulatory protein RseC
MSSTDCVEQKGIIEEINNGIATVNITSFSACSSCESNGACGMSESTEKHIDVAIDTAHYKKGELVRVIMKKSLGLRATLLAYILPFLIVIIALIILTSTGISEGISGLIAIIALALYFFILHLNKNKLQKTFQFTLNKVN